MMERSTIEREVKEDFAKTYEHLLIDAYEELLNEHRRPEDNMRHAMKRMIVLQAKAGRDAERSKQNMNLRAVIVAIATVLQTVVAIAT